jgi:hypothetical protein
MPASRRPEPRTGAGRATASGAGLSLVLAFVGLSLLWNLPLALGGFAGPRASLEIAAILALLALVPALRCGWPGTLAAAAVASATALLATLQVAQLAMHQILARPLNPLLDVYLARSLVDLLTDTLGRPLGWLSLAGLALAPLLVGIGAFLLVRAAQRALDHRWARRATLATCGGLLALFVLQEALPQALGRYRPVSSQASLNLLQQWRLAEEAMAGMAAFETAIAKDRFRDQPADRLLGRLKGADVLLMFVESYGRSALDQPRYGELLVPRLAAFEQGLAARGLLAASGWLISPTVGGQSWLAHGTLESGLWIADQSRYEVLMHSERLTLTRAFARAGYRTVALKPAINRPWPEGERLGFAKIYAAADLGYAGKPYNWVTMPDQYTLAVLERAERAGAARPLFAEVSLISSHAPWTPIAPVLEDWSAIGDGRVFSRWADQGDPPEVVWRDPERVREQYALALDYVLGVLASYAANFVDGRTLLILTGDHQSAPLITGKGAPRDVPIHVVSGDAALLAPFVEWGFVPGMRPSPAAPARRMDAFRDFFLEAFSEPEDATAATSPEASG